MFFFFFFSSRRRHTRSLCDWSSDVCSSDLRKREDLRVLVQLGLPSPGDSDEGRGRIQDGDHGSDPEGQGLRPVRSNPALRAESGPEGLQMRDAFLEFVLQVTEGPAPADSREDAGEDAKA